VSLSENNSERDTESLCIGDIRYNEGQLLDVHEHAPEVLSSHCCHVYYTSTIGEHPEVTRIYSHEAITAEGAGLRS
jgi:hypothetical protein